MDLFLRVLGGSPLHCMFWVCGSIFVVTVMGSPLALSWQRPGIHQTSVLCGRAQQCMEPNLQWFLAEECHESWVSVTGEKSAHAMTSRLWHSNTFLSPTGETKVLYTHISKGKVSSGPRRIRLQKKVPRDSYSCVSWEVTTDSTQRETKQELRCIFPSEIGSQMEWEIDSLFQRK